MIAQYRFALNGASSPMIPYAWAYRLYAWMLQKAEKQAGDRLHQQGENPISQAVYFDPESKQNIWTVNLLSQEAVDWIKPILEGLSEIELTGEKIQASALSQKMWSTTQELIAHARSNQTEERRREIHFFTPTSFKQAGRYVFFPQMPLILQSLMTKWNEANPSFPLDDEDCVSALRQGLEITDYSLRTTRFLLKSVKIPGFYGKIIVTSHLPAPIEEIWRMLLEFSDFCGVGIKTALGMGGVSHR